VINLFSTAEEYRQNAAIIIINPKGKVLWCRRKNEKGWQFPQGGIDKGETPKEAIIREVYEEVGLKSHDINLLGSIEEWLYYDIPKNKIGKYIPSNFRGQKQKWFLAELISSDTKINLKTTKQVEFDKWEWVTYWHPIAAGVDFKKKLYRNALTALLPTYFNFIQEKKRR